MSVANRVRVNARGFLLFGVAALSVAVVDRPNSPAFAQSQTAALTADQRVAIQTAVQTALADIDPSLSVAARAQAIAQALAQVATAQITQNGVAALSAVVSDAIGAGVPTPQAIASILPVGANLGISGINAVNAVTQGAVAAGASPVQTAEAIIAVAAQTNVTSNAVGTGLGQAAAALSSTNTNAASQIALVVANEAPLSTGQAFGSSVLASGGSQQLASVGQQSPTASFITGAVNNTNNNANNNGNNNNNNNGNNNNNNNNGNNNGGTAVTTSAFSGVPLGSGVSAANAPTVNLGSGASQQIAAVGTTLTCTTPSCS
jgi:hypothetical protein